MPRVYCHPAREFRSWAQLSTQCRWQQLSQRSEPRQFSATWLPSRKGPPVHSKLSRECWAEGSGFPVTLVGSASLVTYPVLVEAEGSIRGLASRTPPRNGDSGLCISLGLLERPLLAKARRDLRQGAQKERCHDRRFHQGLRSAVRRQTNLRSLV